MKSLRIPTTLLICLVLNEAQGIPVSLYSKLPKDIQDMLRNKTLRTLKRNDLVPIFPKIFRLNDTILTVNSENAKGSLTLGNFVANGLNSLVDDVSIDLIGLKFSVSLSSQSRISGRGDYNLDGKVNPDEEESAAVSGYGSFDGTVTNWNLLADGKIDVALLSGKVSISNLDLQTSFDSIDLRADNFALNDDTIDWELVNQEINENFEGIWSQYQEPLSIALTEGFNELLSDTTIGDVVEVFQGKKPFSSLIKQGTETD